MSEKVTSISLDNPVFAGRLRVPVAASQKIARQPIRQQPELSYKAWRDITVSQPNLRTPQESSPTKVATPRIAAASQIPHSEAPSARSAEKIQTPDFVKNAEAWQQQAVKKRFGKQKITSLVLIGLAGVLFVFGSYVALQAFTINKKFEGPPTAQAAAASDRDETEPSPSDIMNYKVAPDQPRFIRIAKFNTFSRVLNMGIDQEGRMETPGNIFDAGWYNQSALPGSGSGAAVIGGHVSGPSKGGIFENLDQLVPGDEIEIERGNGQKIFYIVVNSESKPLAKVDMQKAMNSAQPDKAGLTLITCTGALDDSGHHYKDRLLVYAVQK